MITTYMGRGRLRTYPPGTFPTVCFDRGRHILVQAGAACFVLEVAHKKSSWAHCVLIKPPATCLYNYVGKHIILFTPSYCKPRQALDF